LIPCSTNFFKIQKFWNGGVQILVGDSYSWGHMDSLSIWRSHGVGSQGYEEACQCQVEARVHSGSSEST
jgi:hypothetical protein